MYFIGIFVNLVTFLNTTQEQTEHVQNEIRFQEPCFF